MDTLQQLQAIIDDQYAAINILTEQINDYVNVLKYASDKPGLAEQLEVARLYPGKFNGIINLWEMVEMCGVDASDADYKLIMAAMRIVYAVQCHKEPEEHFFYLDDYGGEVSSILYPEDMLPVLRSVLQVLGLMPSPLNHN